jgi:hypothetical protein
MIRVASLLAMALISTSPMAQENADGAARSLGFNSYRHYQQARSYCFDLYNKRVTLQGNSRACGTDFQCLQREANAMLQRQSNLMGSQEWRTNKCDTVMEIEMASRKGGAGGQEGNSFEVVAAIRGCKYFVVEQGASYSLVEDWLCSRPRRGDVGYGDVSSYGIKEVTLDGARCSVYVDDWLLGKSRALDKLADKCQ